VHRQIRAGEQAENEKQSDPCPPVNARTIALLLNHRHSFPHGSACRSLRLSVRGPLRVAAKEAAREPDLIGEKEAEPQADQARSYAKSPTYARGNFTGKHNGQGDGCGDEHHARDGSDAKDEEVDRRPMGVANRCQNEERNGGRASEPVHNTHSERTYELVEADASKVAIEPGQGRVLGIVVVSRRMVCVPMQIDVIAVHVRMRVRLYLSAGRGRKTLVDPMEETSQVHDAKENQHQRNGKLHGQTDSCGNDPSEEDDGPTDGDDCECVADPPQRANQGSVLDCTVARDDRGDGDDVVRVGGVAHPEEKTQRDDGEQANHCVQSPN
jgi:hypothetical protein